MTKREQARIDRKSLKRLERLIDFCEELAKESHTPKQLSFFDFQSNERILIHRCLSPIN